MVELTEMKLFVHAINAGSLSAAGRELGLSPAVASKRLSGLEIKLGVRLVQRTSRQLSLTEEGALYFERCQAILKDAADAESLVCQGMREPKGILNIASPVALGRRLIGPALAEFARLYPKVNIRLSLSDAMVDLVESGFDCAVRIGGPEDSSLVARTLAHNRRIICAAPAYLEQYGQPKSLDDLSHHEAINLSTTFAQFTSWQLQPVTDRDEAATLVRVPVRLSTDNGEQAHDWALSGLGLIRRSIWDVAEELAQGSLVEVLPEWASAQSPIQIVFPSRQFLPVRTRLFIDYLVEFFNRINLNIADGAGNPKSAEKL